MPCPDKGGGAERAKEREEGPSGPTLRDHCKLRVWLVVGNPKKVPLLKCRRQGFLAKRRPCVRGAEPSAACGRISEAEAQ